MMIELKCLTCIHGELCSYKHGGVDLAIISGNCKSYKSTADVVPKSEVERLTNILDSYALQYGTVMDKHIVIEKARQEVAREIFEEIEEMCLDIFGNFHPVVFAELKKKYTESEDKG